MDKFKHSPQELSTYTSGEKLPQNALILPTVTDI